MGSFTTSGGGGVTESTSLTDTADLTYNADTDASEKGWTIDEDNMASDSATKVPTQQSVKAYVDTSVAGVGGAWEYINTYSASAASTLDVNTISTDYNHIKIWCSNMDFSGNGAVLQLQLKDDTQLINSGHAWVLHETSFETDPLIKYEGDDSDTSMRITSSVGNTTGYGPAFTIHIRNLHSAVSAEPRSVNWDAQYTSHLGDKKYAHGSGIWTGTTEAVDGLRLKANTGTITGDIHVYGIKES